MSISGNGTMKFLLETPKYRTRACDYKGKFKFRRPLVKLTLEELKEKPLRYRNNKKVFSIPTCKPLNLPHQDLPVPPFIFGFWYWNRLRPNVFVLKDINFKEICEKLKSSGYKIVNLKKRWDGAHLFGVSPTIESQLLPFIPTQIPSNYILASQEQRIELLSGIINGRIRQYHKKGDFFKISSANWAEIRKLQGLVESVGCRTSLYSQEYNKYYALSFRIRYLLCALQEVRPIKVHQTRRYVSEIEEIGTHQCVHIETDGPDGTFLAGEGYISCL